MPNAQNREYFRVDGRVYFYCEKIPPEESAQSSKKIYIPTFEQERDDIVGLTIDAFRERILMSEIEDEDQKQFLLEMQQIMALMKRSFDAEFSGVKQKIFVKTSINISGSGLAFPSHEAHCLGDMLRVCLFFPIYPYLFLSLAAKVIKSEKQKDGYLVKVHYENISERERDEVLRFVNQCQRDHMHERQGFETNETE